MADLMNFLFALNGSTDNRGCEAILLSTYDLLSSTFPEANFLSCSFKDSRVNAAPYLQLPRLRHHPHPDMLSASGLRWQLAKRLQGHRYHFQRFLPEADFVLSLGGDNYSMDYGSARAYFDANEIILNAGKKLVLWGCSVGPFASDPALERYAAEHLKRLFKIVVRETQSKAYLASLGVTENVVLLPDPAFSLAAEPVQLTDELEGALEAGAIGLNLSPLLARYRTAPERWMDDAVVCVAKLLADVDMPCVFIPHVMQKGNDDAAFLQALAARLPTESARIHIIPGYDLSSRQLKHVISRLSAFIGARTHATIAALSSNVPTISIAYSVKARGINEDIFGHTDWLLNHAEMSAAVLSERVQCILGRGEEIISQLRRVNDIYRIQWKDVASLF